MTTELVVKAPAHEGPVDRVGKQAPAVTSLPRCAEAE